MAVPRLEKIVINMGVSEARATSLLDQALESWGKSRTEGDRHAGQKVDSELRCARRRRSGARVTQGYRMF